MITREVIAEKLLAYLNGQITLATLVDWAENSFIDAVLAPNADVEMLNDMLAYLAAADTAQFPLTWAVCHDFLDRLGFAVQVVAAMSA